jgi:hypothetical protein
MTNCSISLAIKEMQIKTTQIHLTPVRMAIIKKQTTNASENAGEFEAERALMHCRWECKLRKSMRRVLKN